MSLGIALLDSCIFNQPNCIELLLENGANKNYTDPMNKTPLMYASERGHYECVKILIDARSDVNTKEYLYGNL